MGRNAENAGVYFGIRRQVSATPLAPAVAGKFLNWMLDGLDELRGLRQENDI